MKKTVLAMVMIVCLCVSGYCFASGGGSAVSAEDALAMLKEGNDRYAAEKAGHPNTSPARRQETVQNGQHPFATILTCSDSRVPVEYIFDRGIGDLFVIRVAGNVADTDEIGTAEYGVDHLGTPVLMVLGHTRCGAVTAVATGAEVHGKLPQLVDNIIPAVKKTQAQHPELKGEALVPEAIKNNIWQAIEDMLKNSDMLRSRAQSGKVRILGAMYDLETGKVSMLGEHPAQKDIIGSNAAPAGKH